MTPMWKGQFRFCSDWAAVETAVNPPGLRLPGAPQEPPQRPAPRLRRTGRGPVHAAIARDRRRSGPRRRRTRGNTSACSVEGMEDSGGTCHGSGPGGGRQPWWRIEGFERALVGSLLGPLHPHLAEELWQTAGGGIGSVCTASAGPWPIRERALCAGRAGVQLLIQVKGRCGVSWSVSRCSGCGMPPPVEASGPRRGRRCVRQSAGEEREPHAGIAVPGKGSSSLCVKPRAEAGGTRARRTWAWCGGVVR